MVRFLERYPDRGTFAPASMLREAVRDSTGCTNQTFWDNLYTLPTESSIRTVAKKYSGWRYPYVTEANECNHYARDFVAHAHREFMRSMDFKECKRNLHEKDPELGALRGAWAFGYVWLDRNPMVAGTHAMVLAQAGAPMFKTFIIEPQTKQVFRWADFKEEFPDVAVLEVEF